LKSLKRLLAVNSSCAAGKSSNASTVENSGSSEFPIRGQVRVLGLIRLQAILEDSYLHDRYSKAFGGQRSRTDFRFEISLMNRVWIFGWQRIIVYKSVVPMSWIWILIWASKSEVSGKLWQCNFICIVAIQVIGFWTDREERYDVRLLKVFLSGELNTEQSFPAVKAYY
jgi:hypothetical protein